MEFNIYILRMNEEVIYIGKSRNFQNRLKNHSEDKCFNSYSLLECATEADMHVLEVYLIVMLKPLYNKDCVTPSMPSFTLDIDITNLPRVSHESKVYIQEKKAKGTLTIKGKIVNVKKSIFDKPEMKPRETAVTTTLINRVNTLLNDNKEISIGDLRNWLYDNYNSVNKLLPNDKLFCSNRFLKDNFVDFTESLFKIEKLGRSKFVKGFIYEEHRQNKG